jgi:glycosyltransferase involved in cell wall biosynthesis
MPYIVTHEQTGLLSEPGDPQALAHNIIRVLTDPSLASRLVHEAERASHAYRWDAVRDQWLSTYRELGAGVGNRGTDR